MLGTVIGIVGLVVIVGAALLIHRHLIARNVASVDGAWFAGAVTARPGSVGTNVLVVDSTGLRLLRTWGKTSRAWSWAEVQAVRAEQVQYRAALRWPGAVVKLESRWEPELSLIFPPAPGIGASRTQAELAVESIRRGIAQRKAPPGRPA